MRDAEGNPADYAFPSGSRQVVLELAEQGDVLEGSITFGSGVPPEPEAGVAYPPGVSYGLPSLLVNTSPLEGLAYGLTDVSADNSTGAADQVVLSYARFAGFAAWCPLQPALPAADGAYTCSGALGVRGILAENGSRQCTAYLPGDVEQPMDCDYLSLCLDPSPCGCDADGCSADETVSSVVYLQLVDGELRATFPDTVVEGGRLGDVRFQRAAE